LDKKFPTLWLEDIEKATKGAKRVTASMGDVHRRQKELAKELNDVIADSQRGLDMIEELLDKVREKIDLTDDLEKQIKQRHRLLEKLEEEIESAVVNAERSKKPKK
jgi:predicted RNase H-like nuclease (RuvC/YqgF family)